MSRVSTFLARDGREGLVRPARAKDARASLRIVAESVRERPRTLSIVEQELWTPRVWRRHRLDWGPRGVTLVALLGREVVGQLTCHRELRSVTRKHNAEFGITIASHARGLGVGRAMLEFLEEWARDFGVTRIALGVFAGNDRAMALYRSLGYIDEGVERGGVRFPEADIDVIRMSKMVAPRDADRSGRRSASRGYDERGS